MMLDHEYDVKPFHPQLLKYVKACFDDEVRDLSKNTERSELIDISGKSLLHWSSELGDLEMVRYLINKQCNMDDQDNDGNSPLMLAVKAGEEYIIEMLIKAGANVYIDNKKLDCPIKVVLNSWFLPSRKIVKLFLDRLQDDCGSDKQMLVNKLMDFKCPIYFAVLLRDAEVTRRMLDRGCWIEARCHKVCDTALHEAVAQSDLANVKLLVERGLPVDCINYQDQTPLCRYNVWTKDSEEKLEILKFLVAKGAALYYPKLSAPIERLFQKGNKETVHTLLQIKGMNLRRKYSKNRTALHLICMNENVGMTEVIRLFRGKDFDIDAIDGYYGNTALMIAAKKGCVEKVECLLKMGASVDKGNIRLNALYRTANPKNDWIPKSSENYKRIVDLLLQHRANTRLHRRVIFLKELIMNKDFYIAGSYLARLVQMKVLCEYQIDSPTLGQIRRIQKHSVYFAECIKHLKEMDTFTVHGSITMLQLLTASQRQLKLYVRNDEFMSKHSSIVIKNLQLISNYYSNTIRRQATAAIEKVNLERKTVGNLCIIIGQFNNKRSISFEVVNYLYEQDMKN